MSFVVLVEPGAFIHLQDNGRRVQDEIEQKKGAVVNKVLRTLTNPPKSKKRGADEKKWDYSYWIQPSGKTVREVFKEDAEVPGRDAPERIILVEHAGSGPVGAKTPLSRMCGDLDNGKTEKRLRSGKLVAEQQKLFVYGLELEGTLDVWTQDPATR